MITEQQARWLITFYRNLPANRPPQAQAQEVVHQAEVVNDALRDTRRGAGYDQYPYFDLRQMTQ